MNDQIFTTIQTHLLSEFASRMGNAFSTPIPKLVPSRSSLPKLVTSLKNKQDLKPPIAFFVVNNVSPKLGQSYNPQALARFGKGLAKSTDNTTTRVAAPIPVDYNVSYFYVTDDYAHMLDFCGLWMSLVFGKGGLLNFELDYYGLAVQIKVLLSRESGLAFPTDEFTEGAPQLFFMEGQLNIEGYINSLHDNFFTTTNLIHKRDKPEQIFVVDGERSGEFTTAPLNIGIDTTKES